MRKRRTREHVIADLSINHVERFVLRCGYTVQKMDSDYGYDLVMVTYNTLGEVENDLVFFQLKATDHLRIRPDGRGIHLTLALADLELWCRESLPVILILFDATTERAHWLHIQSVLSLESLPEGQETLTVTLPVENLVDEEAIRAFRRLKPGMAYEA